jgi:Insulinase (Peptidase family M16)
MARKVGELGAACLLSLSLAAGCGSAIAPGTSVQTASTLGSSAEVGGSPGISDKPDLLSRALAGDAMGVTIHRLDNGLTVYISTDREQPRISAQIAVRAGSRHDPEGSTGLAHYLEHMLFKGTEKLGTLNADAERPHLERIRELYAQLRGERDELRRQVLLADIDRETQASSRWIVPNEIERLFTRLGAKRLNAFTSEDSTRFLVDVPSNRLEQWAAIWRRSGSVPRTAHFALRSPAISMPWTAAVWRSWGRSTS